MNNDRTFWIAVVARVALGIAVASAIAALIAGPGYRFSWWTLGPAIQTIRWSAWVALTAIIVSIVTIGVGCKRKTRSPMFLAAIGLFIGLAVVLPPLSLYLKVQRLPRIHDITTDTDNPPAFVAVLPLRQNASNSTTYAPETATAQKSGYADIAPKVLKMAPDQAFAQVEKAARVMGWQIVEVSPSDRRIEATDTSLLFGFKDDVVIRVTPLADQSRIDVRSMSRVGGSDFGVNAERIREFLSKLNAN